MTALSDLIAERLHELGYSMRYAAAPNRVKGNITVSAFHRYATGSWSTPSPKAVKGIAQAIEVSVEEVESALDVPKTLNRFKLPAHADRLNPRERQVILSMISTLLAAHRDGAG